MSDLTAYCVVVFYKYFCTQSSAVGLLNVFMDQEILLQALRQLSLNVESMHVVCIP